jgi:L-lactate dehydrogenase complex protein LldG
MSGSEDARSMVLTRIRGALGITKLDRARRAAVIRRLERHPRSTIPAQALLSPAGCVSQLAEMLTKQAAEVARVATPEDAVHAIASYLSSNNLPPQLRIGADLSLAALPWKAAWDISRVYGRAEPSDKACLSRAIVAAAETGTLFLVSGADNPTTLNFLPEFHMVLVKASDIVGSYEEAWDRLRKIYGERTLPRTVNMISGPSRTADIEQTIVRGAHGPRRLYVLIQG